MIATYNKEYVGDVLMLMVADSKGSPLAYERRRQVTRIFKKETGETVAWNIFEASSLLELVGQGQVFLTEEEIARLNQVLEAEGFEDILVYDGQPKFVVGEIRELVPHPDSDHLHICQVAVAEEQLIQIVAGAPNARQGLKTIVALPGAMMPNGSLIFSGELRGVASHGMMCSPRELGLANAPQKRGIIELDAETPVGEVFNPARHWQG